ncbi:molybdopterin converting factor subunit 1 [Aestuariivirga sp.]|uniref:molybdopterin converting factor subunit 1 n=1 Tax=Aestuariivirga sp. TaxID=2650926 RepID=UPI00391B051C
MKILYFARIRQIAGRSSEEVEVPASVSTVAQLIDFLSSRDEAVAAALSERRTLRAAVDQAHVALDAPVSGAREVAFFPPVTGG